MSWITQIVGMAVGEASAEVEFEENVKRSQEASVEITANSEREAELIRRRGTLEHSAFLARSEESKIFASRIADRSNEQIREIHEAGRDAVDSVAANAAARGVVWDSGSPLELAADTAFFFEKQAALKQQEASIAINGALIDAENNSKAGVEALFTAQNQAYTTLLTGSMQIRGLFQDLPSASERFSNIFSGAGGAASSFSNRNQQTSILGGDTAGNSGDTGFSDLL